MARTTIDFGIDLGTTNSQIAVLKGIKAEVIKNNNNMEYTPSAVWITKSNALYVGRRAYDRLNMDPHNAYSEFKRQMGTDYGYQFEASGRSMKPEELSAEVLKSLKNDVKQRLGEDLQAAVITVPASFELPQCEATQKAAKLAGLDTSPLLQEPIAAATACGFQHEGDKVFWMVYDLGGGTFDAAIIQIREGMFHMINHGGNNFLGGKDIDWEIVDTILKPALLRETNLDDFDRGNKRWKSIFSKLKSSAEQAKIQLSQTPSTTIFIDLLRELEIELEVEITQSQVALLAEPKIKESIEISKKTLDEAHLDPEDIERLLLVGGPTFTPYLREMLMDPVDGLSIPLDFNIDPLTIVAQGAAIFAGTQKLERKIREKMEAGGFILTLEYKPVGADEEPIVGGKVEHPTQQSLEGYTIELSRPEWSSGKIPLGENGAFIVTLFAERGLRNTFNIDLFTPEGVQVDIDPDHLSYTIGNTPTNPPIIHSMGVALANNEVAWFLTKGHVLPARHLEVLRSTVGVRHGTTEDIICIPVIEGENLHADLNNVIGMLEITGESIHRDIPTGSEVEVTIDIDESRIIHTSAYIPILDKEFEEVIELKIECINPDLLRQDLEQQQKNIATLQRNIDKSGDLQINQNLEKLEQSKPVEDIKKLLTATNSDPDSANQAQYKLLALKAQIIELENEIKLPSLMSEAKEEIDFLRKVNDDFGNHETRRKAKELETDIHQSIEEHDVDRLRRKIDGVLKLWFQILASRPEYWVGYLQYLEEKEKHLMTDQAQANRLFMNGKRAIQDGDLLSLQATVRQLLFLLPEEEQDAVIHGYGSTLVH